MDKRLIPLKKQNKKAQKEFFRWLRGTWNGINPVTRIPPNSKAYSRPKAKRAVKEAAE